MGKTFVLWGDHGHRPIVLDSYRGKMRVRNEHILMEPLDPDDPDARLIAKAPELLQALKDVLDAYWEMSPLEFAQSRGLTSMSNEIGEGVRADAVRLVNSLA
jgi:hypothetical protein